MWGPMNGFRPVRPSELACRFVRVRRGLVTADKIIKSKKNARRRQKEEVVKVIPTVKPNRSGQMTVQKQLNFILAQEYIRKSTTQLCDSRSESRSKTGSRTGNGSVSPVEAPPADPLSGRNSAGYYSTGNQARDD